VPRLQVTDAAHKLSRRGSIALEFFMDDEVVAGSADRIRLREVCRENGKLLSQSGQGLCRIAKMKFLKNLEWPIP
jgi:hypothetical protein